MIVDVALCALSIGFVLIVLRRIDRAFGIADELIEQVRAVERRYR